MSHTLVTLFTAVIILPIVPLLHKFIMFIYPSSAVEKSFGMAFIDVSVDESAPIQVKVHNNLRNITIVPKPFYKRAKK